MNASSFSTPALALLVALACTSGCATIGKWKQEHREAALHRQQTREAAAHNTESKAERAQREKGAQAAARMPRLQHDLAARGDADSLAASAVIESLISGFDSGAARELAARAANAAPERADLAFLQLQLCESAPTCDPLPLEKHLRLLDPANGITWIYALLRADREHRPQDWEAARTGLAQTQRVDLYWNHIVAHLSKAVTGTAGFDSNAALIEVVGAESALIVALQPVSQACQSQELQRPGVLDQCRRIAAALRRGDTTLIEADGSSLALRVWPPQSMEYRQVLIERRALRYRVELMTRYATQLNSPHAISILSGLLTQYPTEQATMRALYGQLGLKPDPPANWVDPQPDS
jgi:hypothetical protein